MESFGIKDALDIVLVASLLYYLYRIMKESGTINIFFGVLAFIAVWVVASEILEMRLTGTILDKFMNIGLLVLVILFQDQIKRFLVELGSHRRWRFIKKLFSLKKTDADVANTDHQRLMPIVYACMSMAKTKTGALIVLERNVTLENYENTGDIIDAAVNSRLIENIFFKNSPLHDGAMIISKDRIMAAGCILPVSNRTDIPKHLGLRHRAGLGMTEKTDALVVIVSEETGRVSCMHQGNLKLNVNKEELTNFLAKGSIN